MLRKEYHQHLKIVARNRSSYQVSFTYTIPTCFTGTRIPVYLCIYICMYTYVCIVAWDRLSVCFETQSKSLHREPVPVSITKSCSLSKHSCQRVGNSFVCKSTVTTSKHSQCFHIKLGRIHDLIF